MSGHGRVYADLQKTDEQRRLMLTTVGTKKDLAIQGIELREGLILNLYSDDGDEHGHRDDLIFDGVAHFGEVTGAWTAIIDWDAVHHESELSGE